MSVARKRIVQANYRLDLEEVTDLMVKNKLLDEVLARRILREKRASREHPLVSISKYEINDRRNQDKLMTLDSLTQWYSFQMGFPYVRIDPMKINFESVINIVSYAYAARLQILPFRTERDKILIATSEPTHLEWKSEIERAQKKKVEIYVASPEQISSLLEEIYVVQKAFNKIDNRPSREERSLLNRGEISELDDLLELTRQKNYGNAEDSIVQIVDWILNFADKERASDIHLEPKKGLGHIRFRVDGKLRTVYKLHPDAMLTMIARFKILGDMKLDEKRKPQDGQIKYFLDNGKKVEMRLSTIPCQYGEKLVIRIFDKKVAGMELDYIGFNDKDRSTWEEMINESHGLILVTGPTGSGKTTTLYTSLNRIATPDVNVCTVEDPIEMTVDTFNQVQVNPLIDLSFASCVRAFLRQDPDVIMVGEIRDQETGEIAIQASLTGHLVFSTVHTNGALPTIQRLLDLGIPPYLLNSSLSGILAQRLVRKLCPHCKEKIETPEDTWKSLVENNEMTMPTHVYKSVGCDECKQTGFVGRFCIYELVRMNPTIRKAIKPNVESDELKELTKGAFTPIRVNAANKVIDGETSIEEVLKVVY